jgi:hypothetical protein
MHGFHEGAAAICGAALPFRGPAGVPAHLPGSGMICDASGPPGRGGDRADAGTGCVHAEELPPDGAAALTGGLVAGDRAGPT